MVHVQAQVPQRDAAAATRAIAAQGLLHLIDLAHGKVAIESTPAAAAELLAAFRDLSSRLRRVAERLELALPDLSGALEDAGQVDPPSERAALEESLAAIECLVDDAWRRRGVAEEEAARARDAQAHASLLTRAAVEASRLAALRFTTVRLGIAADEALATLATLLTPAPFAIVPLAETGAGGRLAAVAVPLPGVDRLEKSLRLIEFQPLSLPSTPDEWQEDRLRARVEEAEGRGRRAVEDLSAIGRDRQAAILDIWRRAETGALLLQAQTYFAAAGRFVVMSGWIPESQAAALSQTIAAATGNRALITVHRPDDMPEVLSGALQIPILYRNPLLLRPFQGLIELYGVPSYREIEPTAFFAVSFLLMFGLMFGDAGHGLVLFSAGYLLFRRFTRFLDYGILLMECGVMSILFGLLYGSFFGIEGLLPVLWMEPIRDLPRFMAVAVSFGVVLVSTGLLLNVVNSWRAGERGAALVGSRGLFGAFLYWVLLALVARAVIPRRVVVPGWALAVLVAVPVLLLIFRAPILGRLGNGRGRARHEPETPTWLLGLEGLVEVVDALFSFFANTISFVRVAAFAAVHAGVFIAMFALADTLAGVRFGAPLSAIALVAGNAVMILLEGLTVSVQVLRLEYYEFFGKFFRGGGELYRPLMLRSPGRKG
jgi:V/A-type H+-transporting ATPase subunit I